MTSPRELRERLGLSRADWARALNVQEITVKRWEDRGLEPGGTAEEIMLGIQAALDDGIDPRRVGVLVNLGGIRSLVCYAIEKRANAPIKNGHGNSRAARGPARPR